MRKSVHLFATLAVSALLFAGCSQQTETPTNPDDQGNTNQTPPPAPPGETPDPPGEQTPDEPKTEAEIQTEIRGKLARMTDPSGYILPTDANGHVAGLTSLDEVAEALRKKGYTQEIAIRLANSFYKEQSGGAVGIIATEGEKGVFERDKEATFTKKNKNVWLVEQEHPENGLWEPHIAVFEMEVLKDGTYRLNRWETRPLR